MKIWVIGRGFPTEKNQMLGSFELEQAQMLADDHEVYYPVAETGILSQPGWTTQVFKAGEATVYKCSIPIPIRKLRRISKGFCMNWLLRSLEKRFGRPDIIHVHYPSIMFFTCHLKKPLTRYKTLGVKIVCTEHYTKVLTKEIGKKLQRGLQWFAKNTDAFLCVGNPLKKSIRELTGVDREYAVVPNVVNRLFFEITQNKPEETRFSFIAVGRLVPVKQFDMLIDAFTEAFKDQQNVRLTIVGDGVEHEKLKSQIENLGMQSQIELVGTKNREEVAQLLADCDALVCPSRLETFGVPVAEAMACGKPFIGTEAIGFLDSIPENCGIIINSQSKEQLVNALVEIYRHYDQFDRDLAIRTAKDLFSEKAVKDRLNQLYLSL